MITAQEQNLCFMVLFQIVKHIEAYANLILFIKLAPAGERVMFPLQILMRSSQFNFTFTIKMLHDIIQHLRTINKFYTQNTLIFVHKLWEN